MERGDVFLWLKCGVWKTLHHLHFCCYFGSSRSASASSSFVERIVRKWECCMFVRSRAQIAVIAALRHLQFKLLLHRQDPLLLCNPPQPPRFTTVSPVDRRSISDRDQSQAAQRFPYGEITPIPLNDQINPNSLVRCRMEIVKSLEVLVLNRSGTGPGTRTTPIMAANEKSTLFSPWGSGNSSDSRPSLSPKT